jgi:hypothetical protein
LRCCVMATEVFHKKESSRHANQVHHISAKRNSWQKVLILWPGREDEDFMEGSVKMPK